MSRSVENIAGHNLTLAETQTLNILQDYLRRNSGDSQWSSSTSPRGDGREVPISEIFGHRNNQDNAKRQTVVRLHKLGVLRACEIEFRNGMLKGVPLSGQPAASPVAGQGPGTKTDGQEEA